MEKIVYILGAGFSAPLGLPVMSNFRFKSMNLMTLMPDRFKYFTTVFKTITEISVANNYYATDAFNIEEVLSFLEMGDYLNRRKLKAKFKQYVKDVILACTPPYTTELRDQPLTGNWLRHYIAHPPWEQYVIFVCNLMKLAFKVIDSPERPLMWNHTAMEHYKDNRTSYAVVKFNYDRVLEMVLEHLNADFNLPPERRITFSSDMKDGGCPLAKLHGSIDRDIVPPTWSKGTNKSVVTDWKLAFDILSEATQIRILGYSLPVADAYFKYLLKASVIKTEKLQRLDVVCLDPTGSVKARYDEFINFRQFYRFRNGSLTSYMNTYLELFGNGSGPILPGRVYKLDNLEFAHERFMDLGK